MLRIIAKWWGKLSYRWKHEVDAAKDDLNAGLALVLAKGREEEVKEAFADADRIKEHIAQEMKALEEGYWECEDGHRPHKEELTPSDSEGKFRCVKDCGKDVRYLKMSELTGKDKYEIEKELKDARTVEENKRQFAEGKKKEVENGHATAEHFKGRASNNREVSDRLKDL